jgi:two-component system sensor histidine kinase KdpD
LASASDTRPDPDQLLEQIRGAEERAQRGKLRVYFGASAGVGKTYAMLSAAQRERKNGRDVVIGVVETHGRSETAELLAGLEQLPLREVPYRGNALKEFDIDGALARHPTVLLVDELAHSNVEGSRHPKRWQDVQELLEAGIDVWSALNVQHLESLNGTVGAITGIRVHETVPDTVLDKADEIVLVDVTPAELLGRLKAGKVYLPQQAERAAQNFFRAGNLVALREIALRRTAEHVQDDARSYRVEASSAATAGAGGSALWKASGGILVCVGPRAGAEQAVRDAARLAGQLNVRWHAAYVETPRLQLLPAEERERILAVLKLAEELGAGTAVLAGNNVAVELVRQAQTLNCATLLLGRSPPPPPWQALWQRGRPGLAQHLARLAPTLDILEVGQASAPTRRLAAALRPSADEAGDDDGSGPQRWHGYAWAVAAAVAVTALATPLLGHLDLTNIVMLFLLAVVWVSWKFGRGPAALAAFLNVAAFDFFFVPPRFAFAVSDAQYLLTFAVMLVIGLLTGQLTAGLRFSARIAASRERRAQALFALTRELSGALVTEQVCELGANAVQALFGGSAEGGGVKGARALVLVASDAVGPNAGLKLPALLPHDLDAGVADWVFRNGQSAGLTTGTLASQPWHYVPLKAPMRLRGVLALKPAQARWLLIPEQQQLLQTIARQIAIALERVHYVEVAQAALVQMESERLRNTLLAAISHDVRTPLTAILGLADSLRTSSPLTPPQAELAQAVTAQARQLNALVTNLLDMARLQDGSVKLRSEWQSVQEVVGTALRAAQHAIAGMAVHADIPAELPLVEFDAALMERVLVNLLENAAKYGAAPIDLRAQVTEDSLVLTLRDHGPGLPAALKGREDQLFEKFTRGQAESATPGVGLGLAICKAIVDAHRGSIRAANAADGSGAEFTITLPRRAPPII